MGNMKDMGRQVLTPRTFFGTDVAMIGRIIEAHGDAFMSRLGLDFEPISIKLRNPLMLTLFQRNDLRRGSCWTSQRHDAFEV